MVLFAKTTDHASVVPVFMVGIPTEVLDIMMTAWNDSRMADWGAIDLNFKPEFKFKVSSFWDKVPTNVLLYTYYLGMTENIVS
jgi:hypothetical protein